MKTSFCLALVLIGTVFLVEARPGKEEKRKQKRCDHTCKRLSSFIVINLQFKGDANVSLAMIENNVENFCKVRGISASTMCNMFRARIKDIHQFFNQKTGGEMCRHLKICKEKPKKPTQSKSKKDKCKICKSVMLIVKSAIDLANTTFYGMGKVGKLACGTFFELSERKNCLKLIAKFEKYESGFIKHMEVSRLCKIIGFCSGTPGKMDKSCFADLRVFSPWMAALKVAKEVASTFLSDSKTGQETLDKIKKQPFFAKLEQCMKEVQSKTSNVQSRQRRSIEAPRCQVCNKMSQHMISKLQKSDKSIAQLSYMVNKLCLSLESPKDKRRCFTIASLANSTDSLISGIMSPEICHELPCANVNGPDGRGCDICKKVTGMVSKEVKYLVTVIDLSIESIKDLCKTFGSKKMTDGCLKICDSFKKIAELIGKEFQGLKICTDLGIC